jgi:hypothetical protein
MRIAQNQRVAGDELLEGHSIATQKSLCDKNDKSFWVVERQVVNQPSE